MFGWGAIGEGLRAPLRYERDPTAPAFDRDQRIVERATPTRFDVVRNP